MSLQDFRVCLSRFGIPGSLTVALLAAAAVEAHHGTRASYDWTNPTRMTGVVTEFVWRNPHSRLFFDVTDADGNVVHWGGEMNSPTNLARDGWTRTSLEPGDRIELTIYPSKAGTPIGEISRTHPILANGIAVPTIDETRVAVATTPVRQDADYDPRDLSGIWETAGGPRRSVTGEEPAPMTPEGQAKYDAQLPSYGPRAIPPALGNDPGWECNPLGVTRMLLAIRPFQFIELDDKVVQLFARGRTWREIWVDGRSLPASPDPRWLGYSVGRWQGDTFIVETTGFDDRTWLDSYANPHSDALHLEERWRRAAYDRLEVDMVIRDPKIYTEPVVVETKPYRLVVGRDMEEEFCAPADENSFNERIRDPAGGVESAR